MKYNGENSVVIRHEQDERRAERREREAEERAEVMTCPECDEKTVYYEDGGYYCPCGWSKEAA